MFRFRPIFSVLALALSAAISISCGSSNKASDFRILTGIAVTPETADAQDFPSGQVTFTANGTFSLPPSPAPVTFTAPYAGSFTVSDGSIASIVSTGAGTVTVQCVSGATGAVSVVASAAANNGTKTVITASGQLTCP